MINDHSLIDGREICDDPWQVELGFLLAVLQLINDPLFSQPSWPLAALEVQAKHILYDSNWLQSRL